MSRIVRSNTPSLYDNRQLSARALRNDMNSLKGTGSSVFNNYSTSDNSASTKKALTLAALIAGLGAIGGLAATLIGLKKSKNKQEPTNNDELTKLKGQYDELVKKDNEQQKQIEELQKNQKTQPDNKDTNTANQKLAAGNADPNGTGSQPAGSQAPAAGTNPATSSQNEDLNDPTLANNQNAAAVQNSDAGTNPATTTTGSNSSTLEANQSLAANNNTTTKATTPLIQKTADGYLLPEVTVIGHGSSYLKGKPVALNLTGSNEQTKTQGNPQQYVLASSKNSEAPQFNSQNMLNASLQKLMPQQNKSIDNQSISLNKSTTQTKTESVKTATNTNSQSVGENTKKPQSTEEYLAKDTHYQGYSNQLETENKYMSTIENKYKFTRGDLMGNLNINDSNDMDKYNETQMKSKILDSNLKAYKNEMTNWKDGSLGEKSFYSINGHNFTNLERITLQNGQRAWKSNEGCFYPGPNGQPGFEKVEENLIQKNA